jgi:hypothetical protein
MAAVFFVMIMGQETLSNINETGKKCSVKYQIIKFVAVIRDIKLLSLKLGHTCVCRIHNCLINRAAVNTVIRHAPTAVRGKFNY